MTSINSDGTDIGAFEGVVDDGGNVVPDAEKTLMVRPGVSSSFSFADGSRAFIFGIAPLSSGDFQETNADGVLRYENLLGDFYFWSASTGASVLQGVCSAITHTCPQILIENEMKGVGFSIRCIKKE